MWTWTINDVISKFCPREYVGVPGITFELWDVLRDTDTDEIELKPGQRVLGYHNFPKMEINIRQDKELVVIPMRAAGESPDQLVPDSAMNVDKASSTLASKHQRNENVSSRYLQSLTTRHLCISNFINAATAQANCSGPINTATLAVDMHAHAIKVVLFCSMC